MEVEVEVEVKVKVKVEVDVEVEEKVKVKVVDSHYLHTSEQQLVPPLLHFDLFARKSTLA